MNDGIEYRVATLCSTVSNVFFYAVPSQEHPLQFFKNPFTGHFFQPDVFCPSLNIVVEYNGPLHYTIRRVMKRDKLRQYVLCINNTKLLTINHCSPLTEDYVRFRLATEWGSSSLAAICCATPTTSLHGRARTCLRYTSTEHGIVLQVLRTILHRLGFSVVAKFNDAEEKTYKSGTLSMIRIVGTHKTLGMPIYPATFSICLWFVAHNVYPFVYDDPAIRPSIHVPLFIVTKKQLRRYIVARLIDLYHDGLCVTL